MTDANTLHGLPLSTTAEIKLLMGREGSSRSVGSTETGDVELWFEAVTSNCNPKVH